MVHVYTLKITLTTVEVYGERLPKSRLRYQAPGLDIYTVGACPCRMLDKVHNTAMNLALTHKIKLVDLKKIGTV